MNTQKIRALLPVVLLAVAAVAFAAFQAVGTVSSFGWQDIALICPLGALEVMLAERWPVLRVLVPLAVVVLLVVLTARAFCGWLCPVPLVSRLREAFGRPNGKGGKASSIPAEGDASVSLSAHGCASCPSSCSGKESARQKAPLGSRHIVLGGALASAALFGFPVFCLVCPIGLSFATLFLLIRLFGFGDLTWGVVLVPALLLAEVVFFRKWCHTFCPVSALMSLVGKANRTWVPAIDDRACLETSRGVACGRCADVCSEGIDPRHPERGASWSECTKCRRCVDSCPTQAISMPFLARKVQHANAPAALPDEVEESAAFSQ